MYHIRRLLEWMEIYAETTNKSRIRGFDINIMHGGFCGRLASMARAFYERFCG